MDIEETRESLGPAGQAGAVLLVLGLLVIARHNRKASFGTTLVVVGMGLVAKGLVDSALEAMGMKGAL